MRKNDEVKDPLYDAFIAGTLDKSSIQDRQLTIYGEPSGRYAPLYIILDRVHQRVQDVAIDAAVLSTFGGETALYGFKRVGANVLVPIQSCRNMFSSTAWGCFDVDVDAACTIVQEYTGGSTEWYPVHVPSGWNFKRTHEMVRAFNFQHTQRQDPELRHLNFTGAGGVFCKLAEPQWADDVRPLAGSKYGT